MEFCKKCESILLPKKEKDKTVFVCSSCGQKQDGVAAKFTEKTGGFKAVEVVDKSITDTLPKANVECPACGHSEAFFRSEQTRAADEPETLFFTCTKCGKTWREYE